jgi:hypothetical protein
MGIYSGMTFGGTSDDKNEQCSDDDAECHCKGATDSECREKHKYCKAYLKGGDRAVYRVCMSLSMSAINQCIRTCLLSRYSVEEKQYTDDFLGIGSHIGCFSACGLVPNRPLRTVP